FTLSGPSLATFKNVPDVFVHGANALLFYSIITVLVPQMVLSIRFYASTFYAYGSKHRKAFRCPDLALAILTLQ
ncbi:hypothetical protein, partial [Pectobacterium versatile]|uniref:hypothetical protein n=1 Tax=Pectobacterium versatile TaxID=2488639 RepID=UPI001B39F367